MHIIKSFFQYVCNDKYKWLFIFTPWYLINLHNDFFLSQLNNLHTCLLGLTGAVVAKRVGGRPGPYACRSLMCLIPVQIWIPRDIFNICIVTRESGWDYIFACIWFSAFFTWYYIFFLQFFFTLEFWFRRSGNGAQKWEPHHWRGGRLGRRVGG